MDLKRIHLSFLVVGDGDFHLYSRLDVDGCDLTHDLRRRVQVDDSLVDSHLGKEEKVN